MNVRKRGKTLQNSFSEIENLKGHLDPRSIPSHSSKHFTSILWNKKAVKQFFLLSSNCLRKSYMLTCHCLNKVGLVFFLIKVRLTLSLIGICFAHHQST